MDSFEELGLPPELVEALASEGLERPTALQQAALPTVRRGNNALLAAGPGSGTLATWGPAILERIDAESEGTRALVLTPTDKAAQELAEALQRLGSATGHGVAALGSPWVLPGRAHVLFGTPTAVLSGTADGELDLSSVEIFILDQADRIEALFGLSKVEQVLDFIPKDGQRVVVSLPVTSGVEDFVERHVRRSTRIPSKHSEASPHRGTLQYRVVREPRDEAVLHSVAEQLADGDNRHVLLFCRSEDQAADVGDYLALYGYEAGAPGDVALPVWLGVAELEARSAVEGIDDVAVVSCDPPADPDSLDRRYGLHGRGTVLVLPRELAHLRDVAGRTGYSLEAAPPRSEPRPKPGQDLRDSLARAIGEDDIAPYLLLLEPLFERYDPAEVAAAAALLLRQKPVPAAPQASAAAPSDRRPQPQAWVKLFLSVGERDELSARDLLGAITGETNVPGDHVGKIEIRESHCIVEVREPSARAVIDALNGTTIRGRAVRADFDRGKARTAPPRGRAPRRG